jgi:serine/threonine protein kinase
MPPAFTPPLSLAEVQAVFASEGIQVDEVLGSGGQGAAFKATDSKTNKVALKIYGPQTTLPRIEGEIAKLQELDSPHVVKLFQSGDCQLRNYPFRCPYITLEFIDGQPCNELVGSIAKETGQNLDAEISKLLLDVGDGLDVIWSKRIVHRDIKPANIMRCTDGSYTILDFGLAKAPDDDSITATGFVVGTPGYMSPEQARGARRLTIRSDLFALGITAYYIASGEHPFHGFQHFIGSARPKPLCDVCDVSQRTGSAVDSLLELDRMNRPTSISSLLG